MRALQQRAPAIHGREAIRGFLEGGERLLPGAVEILIAASLRQFLGAKGMGPAEVEEALEKHPAVAEAGVVGVPDPDKGQITKAFVVLKEGEEGSDELFEQLKEFLKEHIAIYKLPRAIEYVDSLPRTPTGKLLRRHLRPPK